MAPKIGVWFSNYVTPEQVSKWLLEGHSYLQIAKHVSAQTGHEFTPAAVRGFCRERNILSEQLRFGKSISGAAKYSGNNAPEKIEEEVVPPPKVTVENTIVEDIDIDEETHARKMLDKEKEYALQRRESRLIQELTKKQAAAELLADAMKSSILALSAPDIKSLRQEAIALRTKKLAHPHDEEESILCLGDVHFGEYTNPLDTGGLVEYSVEKFHEKLDKLYNGIVALYDIKSKSHPVNKLNIFGLGDIVTNDSLFPGQAYSIEQNVVDQVFNCAQALLQFVLKLSTVFPEIEISCVAGNHGRMGGTKPLERPFQDNWDYILYKFLEMSLANAPNIKINIPRSWFYRTEIQGWKFLICHGDGIKGQLSIPLYGLIRADSKYSRMLQDTGNFFVVGHFHNASIIPTGKYNKIVINGSFMAGSMLSAKEMMEVGRACQVFMFVHKNQGMSAYHEIYLD